MMNTWQVRAAGVALVGLFLAVAAFAVALIWSAAPQATVWQPDVAMSHGDRITGGDRQEAGDAENATAGKGMDAELFGSKRLDGGVAGGTEHDLAQPPEKLSDLDELPSMSGLGDPMGLPDTD